MNKNKPVHLFKSRPNKKLGREIDNINNRIIPNY